jgi:hypothetical protein
MACDIYKLSPYKETSGCDLTTAKPFFFLTKTMTQTKSKTLAKALAKAKFICLKVY